MAEDRHYRFDLEDRTLNFAKNVRSFVQLLPTNYILKNDAEQLLRSSGSVGANYREANESIGRKDFLMRLRIARKEAKESTYWLDLIDRNLPEGSELERIRLRRESYELERILGAIIRNSTI